METAPDGLYVYQKFGSVSDPNQDDRLYAVSGFRSGLATVKIEGLTSNEAHRVCEVLQALHDDAELEYHKEQVELLESTPPRETEEPPPVKPGPENIEQDAGASEEKE